MKHIQALLSADEAMTIYSVLDTQSYVIAVTRRDIEWKEIQLGADAPARKVAAFRRRLNPAQEGPADGRATGGKLQCAASRPTLTPTSGAVRASIMHAGAPAAAPIQRTS